MCVAPLPPLGFILYHPIYLFYELFHLDSSDDITQTTDINENTDKIPLETIEIVNQSNLTQSESIALLQFALNDVQSVEVAEWAQEIEITVFM